MQHNEVNALIYLDNICLYRTRCYPAHRKDQSPCMCVCVCVCVVCVSTCTIYIYTADMQKKKYPSCSRQEKRQNPSSRRDDKKSTVVHFYKRQHSAAFLPYERYLWCCLAEFSALMCKNCCWLGGSLRGLTTITVLLAGSIHPEQVLRCLTIEHIFNFYILISNFK